MRYSVNDVKQKYAADNSDRHAIEQNETTFDYRFNNETQNLERMPMISRKNEAPYKYTLPV